MKKTVRLLTPCISLCLSLFAVSCSNPYPEVPVKYHALLDSAFVHAGENGTELKKVLAETPAEQKEGMAYLIAYMPDYDLTSLSAEVLKENVEYAYRARREFEWCKELPDSIFFNEVLPYHNVTETRDNWRKMFYERFSPYVKDCATLKEAVYAVNKNVRDELLVDYNTKRRASDQGPFESMESKMASCTGLTILLNDAFRAVGIPARFAGTANWFDNRGNHSWNEVLIDGEWYFTEYYPEDLNRSWFATDAAKATVGSKNNGIFAVSYKPTGSYFPLEWDPAKKVNAVEVTPRYLEVCAYAIARDEKDSRVKLDLEAFNHLGYQAAHDNRIPVDITLYEGEKQIGGGTTCSTQQDLNNYLTFLVDPEKEYTVVCVYDSITKKEIVKVSKEDMRHRIIMK